MRKTDLIIKRTKHFWERVGQRDIDFSAILDVYSQAAQAKIGSIVIGSNQNTEVVARKVSCQKVVLITAYEKKKNIATTQNH